MNIEDTLWYELINLLKEKQYNITETLDVYCDKYPKQKTQRGLLAVSLSWYRRNNKRINIGPRKKVPSYLHKELIEKTKTKLDSLGYKAVIIGNTGHRIPDIVAFKNNKVCQVEIQTILRSTKEEYEKRVKDPQYDEIIVICPKEEDYVKVIEKPNMEKFPLRE